MLIKIRDSSVFANLYREKIDFFSYDFYLLVHILFNICDSLYVFIFDNFLSFSLVSLL